MDKSISTLSAHNSPYPFRRMWTLSIAACIICTIVLLYSPLSPVGDLRLHERFHGMAALGYSGQWRVDEREVWRKQHKLCAVKDVVEGEWVVKKRLENKDELFERYGFSKNGSIRQFCEPTKVAPTKLPNGQKSWPKEALLERLLDVASPEFVPRPNLARARGEESYWSSECNVAPLAQREFIKRMLRSRAGLVLVGDSLTQQHVGQLENFLSMTPYVQRQGFKDVITRLEFRLDLQSASYAAEVNSIIQEAGVTRERAAKPFMTYLRHHHLTMPEESDMIFKDISPAYELTKQPIGMDWFARLTGMVDEEPFIVDEESVEEEPSVVILNTGPHWTGGEFGKMNQSDFRIAYGRMVELVDKKVRNAPFPISTYWRSVLPGQADCKPMDKFDNARTDTLSPEDPGKGVFNYLWFPWMNEWMEQGRSSERPTKQFRDWFRQYKAFGIAPINPPSLYLDAYPMSVKRPEAHHSPPVDCLHFCDIGVPDQWTALMWHMIVLESLNTDYI